MTPAFQVSAALLAIHQATASLIRVTDQISATLGIDRAALIGCPTTAMIDTAATCLAFAIESAIHTVIEQATGAATVVAHVVPIVAGLIQGLIADRDSGLDDAIATLHRRFAVSAAYGVTDRVHLAVCRIQAGKTDLTMAGRVAAVIVLQVAVVADLWRLEPAIAAGIDGCASARVRVA